MQGLSEIQTAMDRALRRAQPFRGATSPNPPVGATVLDKTGLELASGAHEKVGQDHAEVRALELCAKRGLLPQAHTLVVTLEPCNHYGKTPPCVGAITEAELKRVVVGALDPNPAIHGQGVQELRAAGVEVVTGIRAQACEELIEPFAHWVRTQRPWVTLKQAFDYKGSMIPPKGQKTFSDTASLIHAHQLRRRADAILTGVGTVLSDRPEFTVRHVHDHLEKIRPLVVMDRNRRTPQKWIAEREREKFEVHLASNWQDAMTFLGTRGCLEVLVEAGPTLSTWILEQDHWNEHHIIRPDSMEVNRRV